MNLAVARPEERQATRPDVKRPRPTTLREAQRDVDRTYRQNRWDRETQMRFEKIVGLEPKATLEEYGVDEIRALIDRMVNARMILYLEEKGA